MALDKNIRNRIQKLVTNCRSLLTKEYTEQLQSIYGIQPDGTIIDVSGLTHLSQEEQTKAGLLRQMIQHITDATLHSKKPSAHAVEQIIREQAFTTLNRFAALRMCEEREIVQESIRCGYESKGFKLFQTVAGTGIGEIHKRYEVYLKSIFDEISLDLGILFDRFSHMGLLFPGENTLLTLLEELNNEELETVWQEDETIGWIYQYFNSKEERKKMRDESSAPRNSRELAVRNQFFTPRYVVQFLTDNTLGRIWYEMTQGETVLKDQCEYMVRRPNEIFLKKGEEPPSIPEEEEEKSQEVLLKEPEYIPHRELKDPREILMLDPACGSMHFGLYAFDLFETIYEEAWDNYPELLKDIRLKVKTKDEFLSLIPDLIIRYNIHGIDIDRRAAQIAGLSLWLRAQKTYQRLEIPAAGRPRITKSNVVCAEPMPGEKNLLDEFTKNLKPTVLGDLVKQIWDKMKLAGEAGSLLKIEEEIQSAINRAKMWWKEYKHHEQDEELFEELKQSRLESIKDMAGFDASEIKSLEDWEDMERLLLKALADFAEKGTENGYIRKLFAEDAVGGFAFIDVCRKKYNVILMNPPFGEVAKESKGYIQKNYPRTKNDLYAAFVESFLKRIIRKGRLGAITSRTGFFLSSFTKWREEIILKESNPVVFADFGFGVLDAMVETAAYCLEKAENISKTTFFRVLNENNKGEVLYGFINSFQKKKNYYENIFIINTNEFKKVPNKPFAYWVAKEILNLFVTLPPFESEGRTAKQGLATADDFRFVRLWWETKANNRLDVAINSPPYKKNIQLFQQWCQERTFEKRYWVPFAKGGEYSPYYSDIHLVINWKKNGEELSTFKGSVIRNPAYYFKPGLTWSDRTTSMFSVRIWNAGGIFSTKGSAGFFKDNYIALSILNSLIYNFYLSLLVGAASAAAKSYQVGIISVTPYCCNYNKNICKEIQDEIKNYFYSEKYRFYYDENSLYSILILLKQPTNNFNLKIKLNKRLEQKIWKLYNLTDTVAINSIKIMLNENIDDYYKRILNSLPIENKCVKYVKYLSYLFGLIFSRWDIRLALNPDLAPELADPFDPLPICPPGMLQGPDGLPATPGNIVSEEWLKVRPNVITLPPEGSLKKPTIKDEEYPIPLCWEGILVDDPEHEADIIRRMRLAFEVIWKDNADAIEQEACEILGIKDLRTYFNNPNNFFADHLKRYSKSRRKAPIYWPLSTSSDSYTLWIYYPRLTDQTLYKCIMDYIDPKIETVEREINIIKKQTDDKVSKSLKDLDKLIAFKEELQQMKNELQRIISLPYKPDLNDGVLITAAPLNNLFQLKKWQKDLKDCWKKLEKGDYDWAHLAYSIWPDRVKEKCRKDRSLAIAHDLEDICEVKPVEKKKKGKKQKELF